ncbi:MAG: GAF domain-containing protein [Candidatus Zhuqueibacterota bacterium]
MQIPQPSYIQNSKLLSELLHEINKMVQFSWGGLFFYYETDGRLRLAHYLGQNPQGRNQDVNAFALWVASHKESLLISDFREEKRFRQEADLASVLFVPVLLQDACIGVIGLERREQRAFSHEELALVSQYAEIATKEIEDVIRFRELEERASQLHTLVEIGQALASVLNLNELFEKIYEQVGLVMDVDAFFICCYEPENDYVTMEFVMDEKKRFDRIKEPLGPGVASQAIRQKRAIVLNRTVEEYEKLKLSDANPFGNRTRLCRSLIAAPIMLRDKVIGAISAQSYRFNSYSQQQMELLAAIGNQSAVAIENARLYEREKMMVSELTAIKQIDREITSTLDVDEMVKAVANTIIRHTKFDYVSIFIVDHDRNTLVKKAAATRTKTNDLPIGFEVSFDQGLIGWTARNRKTRLTNDVSKDEFYVSYTCKTTRAELCVPIEKSNRLYGVFNIENYETNSFSEHDVPLIENISYHLSQMLENARLFDMIRIEKDKLEKILYNLNEGVSIIDAEYRITYMNQWMIDRFGKEVIGQRCDVVLSQIDPILNENLLSKAFKEKLPAIETKTARREFYSVLLSPIKISNKATGILAVINDTTHKKRYEIELIHSERYKAVINLAAAVAHELNQPLTGIACYCSLLLEEIAEGEKHYEEIFEIDVQANRLMELIRKIQTLARVETREYFGDDEILNIHAE